MRGNEDVGELSDRWMGVNEQVVASEGYTEAWENGASCEGRRGTYSSAGDLEAADIDGFIRQRRSSK